MQPVLSFLLKSGKTLSFKVTQMLCFSFLSRKTNSYASENDVSAHVLKFGGVGGGGAGGGVLLMTQKYALVVEEVM